MEDGGIGVRQTEFVPLKRLGAVVCHTDVERSRVRRGPGGEIKAARYGAILPSASSPFGQAFEVFFNPVDNERSLEPEDRP